MQKLDIKKIEVGIGAVFSAIAWQLYMVRHELLVSKKSTIFGAGNSSRNCLFSRLLFEGQLIATIIFELVMCANRIAKRNVKINSEK